MDYNFERKNILVTGSGRGIGRGIATSLAAAGAKVYALDRDQDSLDALVKEIPTMIAIHQDLKNWEQTKETASQIMDLDGLVNCAAEVAIGAAVDVTNEQLDLILDVNLKAAINLMQVVGKKMVLNGRGGSIVNISSTAGTTAASKNMMAYSVAKAGLNMATKVFALELGPHKVRVNSVAPAIVNTKMVEVLSDEIIKRIVSALPMGRMLEVEDVVQCVLFLLSGQSKMITGTTVMVDGGHTCYLPV